MSIGLTHACICVSSDQGSYYPPPIIFNRPLARWRQASKQPAARTALREFSSVADRLLTRKTMAEALVLFREVDINGAVLPEKVVDKKEHKGSTDPLN